MTLLEGDLWVGLKKGSVTWKVGRYGKFEPGRVRWEPDRPGL